MRAKKSLGQHFLKNQSIAARIADAATLSTNDTVLEIGPGTGMLTKELLQRARKVFAIEKDERLAADLREIFAVEIGEGKLEIIEGDALEIGQETLPQGYKLVSNIPYYITGAIIRQFLTAKTQPKSMVLLIQKEVAERIIARDGKESLLSISVKAYGTPRIITTVKAGSFIPAPKVDSAVLAIENISRTRFSSFDVEIRFFELLRAGFGQKRKVLRRNLESITDKEHVSRAFEACTIKETARAEQLSPEEWGCIVRETQPETR
jgi:16S rRNA (adenine1518-N6/adenine1519-N6)-dimethyltransferase